MREHTPAEPRLGTIRHARTNLPSIVKDVAATGKHYALGPNRSNQAVIVPSPHAIPETAVDGIFSCAAETAGYVAHDKQLPTGVTDLLIWWASLSPTPPQLPAFLSTMIATAATDDEANTIRATICQYTGWSKHDLATYTATAP